MDWKVLSREANFDCNLLVLQAPVCSKRTVNCCAVPSHESHVNPTRRVALLGLGLASISAANLAKPDRSWALLPDDDDADLVQKAKASRQRKIQVRTVYALMWILS